MLQHRVPPGPHALRSRRMGRAWSAAGTLAGLIASWGAVGAGGSAHGAIPTGEIVATALAGLWLLALGVGWWRDRRS